MNQEPDETSPLPESNDDGQPEASESSEMTDTRNPQAEADGEGSLAPKEQEAEENNGEEKENGRGLNFIDHLDEIRGRIIHSAIALILMVALSAIFADFLVEVVIIGPLKKKQRHTGPAEPCSLWPDIALPAGGLLYRVHPLLPLHGMANLAVCSSRSPRA